MKILAFIISMSTSLYEISLKNLESTGFNFKMYSGVNGKMLNREYLLNVTTPQVQYTINKGRKSHWDIPSLGAVGCSLSHIHLWKQLIEDEKK